MCLINRNLLGSVSLQNVYFTYVCLVNNLPNNLNRSLTHDHNNNHVNNDSASDDEADEDKPIKVERSIALHNLDLNDSSKENPMNYQMDSPFDGLEPSDDQNFISYDNPNVLKLTRMKWLSDESDGCPDTSSPSISPSISSTNSSIDSVVENTERTQVTDKCLKTILSIDREQNMFGLSNIVTLGQPMKPVKADKRPAFPQTAIVQVCTTRPCRKSNTDFPASLKCGTSCSPCTSCAPSCGSCYYPVGSCCGASPCYSGCPSCINVCYPSPCKRCCKSPSKSRTIKKRRHNSACRPVCSFTPPPCPGNRARFPVTCRPFCCVSQGMTITVRKKDNFKLDDSHELTPRSSCILSLPLAVRKCTHTPRCVPPTSGFPFYMPCYWPSRPSAPCSTPSRCFHKPACMPRRKRNVAKDPNTSCPTYGTCTNAKSRPETDCKNKQPGVAHDCSNPFCPGKVPNMKAAVEEIYGASASRSPPASPKSPKSPPKSPKSPPASPKLPSPKSSNVGN